MEAIGDDLGLGEVLADQGTINACQVHTHDADAILAGQVRQVSFQGGFTAPEDHVKDLVPPQIAKSGRVSILPGKEMLIAEETKRTVPRPDWLVVKAPQQISSSFSKHIGMGEREAIALALEIRPDAFIVDDYAARVLAN